MLFYRSAANQAGASGPSLRTIRTLTLVALAAYPIGGIIMVLGPDGKGGFFLHEAAGLALITLALFCAAPVLGSRLQRIVGDQPKQLDEWELQQRHQAMSSAYALSMGLICAGLIYAAVASDAGWWLPRSYDAFNGMFWGVFLYATLLPTAFLAWRLDEDEAAES
jgi:drug/metabolite transporter (DMT)-like permease